MRQAEISLCAQFPPAQADGAPLHHIGFVVPRISTAVEGFISSLQMLWDGKVFDDPVQTVRVAFLRHIPAGMPMIELVEPASPQSRVAAFAKRGGGLHHLCYEVDSLENQLKTALSSGAILLVEPAPAVAFSWRKIAWVCTPNGLFVEYLARL